MKVLGYQVGEAVPIGALLDLNVEGGEEAADTTALPARTRPLAKIVRYQRVSPY